MSYVIHDGKHTAEVIVPHGSTCSGCDTFWVQDWNRLGNGEPDWCMLFDKGLVYADNDATYPSKCAECLKAFEEGN